MLGKQWLVNGVTGENKEPNASSCAGLGHSIGMRRPVIAATKKRRDLAGPPLGLNDFLIGTARISCGGGEGDRERQERREAQRRARGRS